MIDKGIFYVREYAVEKVCALNGIMSSIKHTPWFSVIKTFQYALTGRLHFPKEQLGARFVDEHGQQFRVFRYAIVDSRQTGIKPKAIFVAHFHVAGMSVGLNKLFSLLPIPFFIGLPGFRSKYWMVDEVSGDFAGYYEWDTVEDAENYAHSFAAKFMTWRSVPNTVWFKVYPIEKAPAPPMHIAVKGNGH